MLNCKNVEEKIMSGESLGVDEQLHLLECRHCQEFAAVFNLAVGIPKLDEATDASTLAKCRALIRRRPMRSFRKVIATSAACLILLLALYAIHGKRTAPQNELSISETDQWLLAYSLDNDDISDTEIILSGLELPLISDTNEMLLTANQRSVVDLQYEILSLEMDMNFK